MEREAVEAKTQRFQQKMDQLRPILEDRKKVHEQQRTSGRLLKNGVMVAVLGLAGSAFFALSVYQPSPSSSPEQVPPSPAARPAVSGQQEKPAPAVVAASPPAATPAEEPSLPPVPASPGEAESSPPAVATLSFAVAPAVAAEAPAAQAPAAEVPPAETSPAATNGPTNTPPAQIRIGQSLSCRGVQTHQCRQPQSSFALHEHNQPHVWMVAYSQFVPHVLTHVYYHEGQKYCEVPLTIAYPRMRTWSSVTLNSPARVGSWRVEIVTEEGEVLDQVAFRVSP